MVIPLDILSEIGLDTVVASETLDYTEYLVGIYDSMQLLIFTGGFILALVVILIIAVVLNK